MSNEEVYRCYDNMEEGIEKDTYYVKNILPLIVGNYDAHYDVSDVLFCDYMILTAGNSYEPLAYSICSVQPKNILFLQSETSRESVSKIINLLKLTSNFKTKTLRNENNVLEIYNAVKKYYHDEIKKTDKVVVDLTGGKKVMSAAVAMAGTIIDAKIIYISSKFQNGMHVTGTERMELVKNPFEVFGDIEYDKALELMRQNRFIGATDIFERLHSKVGSSIERTKYGLMELLSKAYFAWDSMNFDAAYNNMNDLCAELQKYDECSEITILTPYISDLLIQRDILKAIAGLCLYDNIFEIMQKQPDSVAKLIFSFQASSNRRASEHNYDMGVLLLYRLVEMIMQRRLSSHDIYVNNADYSKLFPSDEALKEFENANKAIKKKIYTPYRESLGLPIKIALMDGYIMLCVIRDKIFEGRDEKKSIDLLRWIYSQVEKRNTGIFAHGFKPASSSEYDAFKRLTDELLKIFCSAEDISCDTHHYEFIFTEA